VARLNDASGTARDRAIKLIRDGFDVATAMRKVDLESINLPRPPQLRYKSHEELFREFWHAAGAVSTFAVVMGLITPSDEEEIIRDYTSRLDSTVL
jgi:hypothetical protein